MKSKIIRILSIALISALIISAFAGCTIKPYYEGAPEGMRPINEGEEKAILYVPDNWQVDTSTGIPTAYYSTNDMTMITLVTVKADVLAGRTIPDYWASYKETFSSSVKDFTVIKENETDPDYTTRLISERSTYVFDFSATVTGLKYKFRQALLTHPLTGDLLIITYSSTAEGFDQHIDDLGTVYNNFTFVTEKIPMTDKTEVVLPENTNAPEGYITVSSEFVDYYLYVPSDWTAVINTGMTAAHAPESVSTTVNATAFSTTLSNLDEYWAGYETDLTSTYGAVTYADPEHKYTEAIVDGFSGRKYAYSLTISGVSYNYEQYMVLKGGYIYLLTFCCETENADLSEEFNDIAANFKFK